MQALSLIESDSQCHNKKDLLKKKIKKIHSLKEKLKLQLKIVD